ncbi:signal peptidase I [Streptomyces sp. NPDC006879]|uniref:signal peptidase I n=1 Tax=Streptomyces sp. NPDC006879 TaxID=3364767 RepID=UPI00367C7A97
MGGTGRTGTTGRAERTREGHRRGLGSVLSGLVVATGFVLFLGGFIWAAVVYQPFLVPTDSMTPTVKPGERVLAQRIDGDQVRRGDIVIFRDEVWGDLPMVKRVVGVGGDKVACCRTGGRLTLNGAPVEEPYLHDAGDASTTPFEVTVPEDKLFLLGDDRSASLDSRAHLQEAGQGTVSRSAVLARLDAVVWPLGNMIERPAAYEHLPGGTSAPGPLRTQAAVTGGGALLIVLGASYGPLARLFRRGRKEPAGVR